MSKEKSKRKTLFLSFIDATDKQMSALQDIFVQSGITEDYRIIATPRPMQVLNEQEMAEVMAGWTGENQRGLTQNQLHNIRSSIHFLEKAVQKLSKHQLTETENMGQIENTLNALNTQLQVIANSNHLTPPSHVYFNRLVDDTLSEIKTALQNLERYSPKEGVEW